MLEDLGEVQGFVLAFHEHELNFDHIVNQRIRHHAKNDYIVLKQVCIKRKAQKQGYGRRLYEHLMSVVEKDIYLAVVLDPPNQASLQFHHKLGFKKIFEVYAEDQRKRGIFFWNHPTTETQYDKEILLEQYKLAVDLYKHEDLLNWSKINHLLYVSGGLIGFISLLANVISIDTALFKYWLCFLAVFGILSAILFQININSGINYLQKRKKAVVNIESIFHRIGGVDVVYSSDEVKQYKRSPTTFVIKLLPKAIIILWTIVLLTSLLSILFT